MSAVKRLGDDTRFRRLVTQWDWARFFEQCRVGIDRTGARDPRARGLQSGVERELCEEALRGLPGTDGVFDPWRPVVPWEVFQRDVSTVAGGGGYLVASGLLPVAEVLRPWSVIVGGGVPPSVRKLLGAREKITTSGRMIWDGDLIDNRPARITPACPAATLICADLTQASMGVWGVGPQIEITDIASASALKAGTTQVRVLTGIGFAIRHPAAFYALTSVS